MSFSWINLKMTPDLEIVPEQADLSLKEPFKGLY